MTDHFVKMQIGVNPPKTQVSELMICEAEEQFLRGTLTTANKWLIDAILSFVMVSLHKGHWLEQPNDRIDGAERKQMTTEKPPTAPVESVVVRRAWLHRRGKPTWMFEPSQLYGELVHETPRGTVYAILADHKCGDPFWIGRLCESTDGRKFWGTCERQLLSRSIEFEDAGDYVFPSA